MNWRHRALCRDEDPNLFFPEGTTGPAEKQAEEAKAVCRRCPVTSECLSWALDTGQDHGVLGGLTEEERRLVKRRLLRPRVRTAMPDEDSDHRGGRAGRTDEERVDLLERMVPLRRAGETWTEIGAQTGLSKDGAKNLWYIHVSRLVGIDPRTGEKLALVGS